MTVIKATLYSYHYKDKQDFYFSTRKSKIKISKLVNEISKNLFISPDFTTDLDYSKRVNLNDLYYAKLEDEEAQFLLTFDLIEPTKI